MFQFANEGKVWWKINLVARNEVTGDVEDAPVMMLYRIFTRAELKQREKRLQAALGKLRTAKTDAEMQAATAEFDTIEQRNTADTIERVCDWRDIVSGADSTALPFSRESLKALLDDEAQYTRIASGLLEASRGARAKNSSPGPAGSQVPGQN